MTMTNAQAALMAAASQIPPGTSYNVPGPNGDSISVDFTTATRTAAAIYLTWLIQQDELDSVLTRQQPADG